MRTKKFPPTKFTGYWARLSAESKRRLADAVDSEVVYLSQIAHGHRRPSPQLTFELERETGIRRAEFRPDIYGRASKSPPQAVAP